MLLFFIRHGLTDHNIAGVINGQRIDEPLAAEGERMVAEARELLPRGLAHIFCSTMVRARQTANILNQNLHLPITYHDELREVDFGELSGKTWDQVTDMFGDTVEHKYRHLEYDFHLYDGESVADVKARLNRFFVQLTEAGVRDGTALVVTHGGIIRLLYNMYIGEEFGEIKNATIHEINIRP